MDEQIDLNATYAVSEDIIAREIEGELIIIPITSGIGEAEDDMYSLNETGRAIWRLLDGQYSIAQIIQTLNSTHEAEENEIQTDVMGLLGELLKRKMVVRIEKD